MTEIDRDFARAVAAMFDEPQPELPARALDVVRQEVHETRQRFAIGGHVMRSPLVTASIALPVVVAVTLLLLGSFAVRQEPDIGGPAVPTASPAASPTPTPSPVPSRSAAPSQVLVGPTTFTSPLYGNRVTLPGGWRIVPARVRWSGGSEPGPFAQADTFNGPNDRTVWSFAGPFDGDLAAFVQDRIAATARDHADTCPDPPAVNRPTELGGEPAVLLGWNCGGVINEVVTIRDGVAWEFAIRDLTVQAATDPAVTEVFDAFLASVEFPG